MAKKQKSDATRLDEVDRTMYSTFCTAANSLSQLYTQAMNHQKLSFQAGERYALVKLHQWILRQQEAGSKVTTLDIFAYLQNELECGMEEPSMYLRAPLQQQPQNLMHPNHATVQIPNVFGPTGTEQGGGRVVPFDQQPKNVFSNALSSPVRRSLQHCQLDQGGYQSNVVMPGCNGVCHTEPTYLHPDNRETSSPCFNDSSMEVNEQNHPTSLALN